MSRVPILSPFQQLGRAARKSPSPACGALAWGTQAGWDVTAAQIPQQGRTKLDWNDMHQRDRLDAKAMGNYRYHGALLVAESAGAKAVLMYQHGNGSSFPFEFDHRLWWFKLDLDKYHKASEAIADAEPDLKKEEVRERALLEAHAVTEIATCYPQALYYQRQEIPMSPGTTFASAFRTARSR